MGNIASSPNQCEAKFDGDPDIAGPGVMAAFLITGWLTFAAAAVVGCQKAVEDYHALLKRNEERKILGDEEMQTRSAATSAEQEVESTDPQQHESLTAKQKHRAAAVQQGPEALPTSLAKPKSICGKLGELFATDVISRWNEPAKAILAPLCDLQVVTGTAMLVAGFAQGNNLTYYHELIICSYWNITLNSFWAAQIGNPQYEHIDGLASRVRNGFVLGSTVLSIVFQIRFNNDIFSQWESDVPGKCYILNHDGSGRRQATMWVVDLSTYAVIMAVRILGVFNGLWGFLSFKGVDKKILTHFKRKEEQNGMRSPHTELICRLCAWLVTSFMAVWSFGSGSFGIETVAILGYLSWNTLDVIDAKVSNHDLIDGLEASWGYGQVLPMVLLGTILFSVLDAFTGHKTQQKRGITRTGRSENVLRAM